MRLRRDHGRGSRSLIRKGRVVVDVQEITYTVRGLDARGRGLTLVHRGTDWDTACQVGAQYAQSGADGDRAVCEVLITAQNYWGEVSVTGRFSVRSV